MVLPVQVFHQGAPGARCESRVRHHRARSVRRHRQLSWPIDVSLLVSCRHDDLVDRSRAAAAASEPARRAGAGRPGGHPARACRGGSQILRRWSSSKRRSGAAGSTLWAPPTSAIRTAICTSDRTSASAVAAATSASTPASSPPRRCSRRWPRAGSARPDAVMRPLVSIGVPIYRGERFLAETLHCIEAQTYRDFCVLMSLDGPDPACEAICRPFLDDSRFRLVVQPRRLGWVGHFNWLLSQAEGDFWYYHQQDDLTDPVIRRGAGGSRAAQWLRRARLLRRRPVRQGHEGVRAGPIRAGHDAVHPVDDDAARASGGLRISRPHPGDGHPAGRSGSDQCGR